MEYEWQATRDKRIERLKDCYEINYLYAPVF